MSPRTRRLCLRLLVLLALTLAPRAVWAESPEKVSFQSQVAPLLFQKCHACHSADKPKGRFRLDTFEMLMKPGASDSPSVVPGHPEQSELFRLITTKDADERMPQKDEPLSAEQVGLIERWIREGAAFDGPDPKAALATLVAASAAHPRAPQVYPRPVPIFTVAFSPDGKELAVGGYHEVTVWDPAEGKLLGRIGNLPQQTQALAYNAEGTRLVAAGGTPGAGGEVKLLDPLHRSEKQSLMRTPDMVYAAAFRPDGSQVAAGGADNAIHLFDVATGKRTHLIEQHADWVLGLSYSADGAFIASASRDRSARVYDAKSGAMVHGYQGHTEPVFFAAFSPDGKRVYSAGRDKVVHVWKSTEGERAESRVAGAAEDVFKVLVARGFLFTCSADRKVRQYKTAGGELVRTFEGHQDWVYALAYDEKTNRLASASFDGEVRVWDVEEGKLVRAFVVAPGYEKKR